ncbi:MAG: tetratricopeptide repeat protein, partial [Bacteroidota bacterium]
MSKRKRSFNDKVRETNNQPFIGREAAIEQFRKNLEIGTDSNEFLNIFNVHGQGGVGKSTLIERRYLELAKASGYCSAFVNLEDNRWFEIPSLMEEIAKQLESQEGGFKKYRETYKLYLQEKGKLEKDPERPKGALGKIIREGLKIGGKIGREALPGGGLIVSDAMIGAVSGIGSEWTDFVMRKITNIDEVELVLNPIETLTPIWIQCFNKLAEKRDIALFLDTYEAANPELDSWLNSLIGGKYEIELPINFILCIGGRKELDKIKWEDFYQYIANIPLEPFTEKEAKAYLEKRKITSPNAIEQIISISNCLPVYLSLLAEGDPDSEESILDPNEKVVERFLKYIKDPIQRRLVLHTALAHRANKDMIRCLLPEYTSEDDVDKHFAWLKNRPFIKQNSYHEVVRDQMMLYQLEQSEKEWEDVHLKLAKWYKTRIDRLWIEEREACFEDQEWKRLKLKQHFHLLCVNYRIQISSYIIDIVSMMRLLPWAELFTWLEILDRVEIILGKQKWNEVLKKGLIGWRKENESDALLMIQKIVKTDYVYDLEDKTFLFFYQGYFYHDQNPDKAISCYEKAIEIKPDDHQAFYNMGIAYDDKGERDKAISCYEKAIEIKPDLHQAFYNMGNAYSAKGERDKA